VPDFGQKSVSSVLDGESSFERQNVAAFLNVRQKVHSLNDQKNNVGMFEFSLPNSRQ
jgi:hypothetical protein